MSTFPKPWEAETHSSRKGACPFAGRDPCAVSPREAFCAHEHIFQNHGKKRVIPPERLHVLSPDAFRVRIRRRKRFVLMSTFSKPREEEGHSSRKAACSFASRDPGADSSRDAFCAHEHIFQNHGEKDVVPPGRQHVLSPDAIQVRIRSGKRFVLMSTFFESVRIEDVGREGVRK